MEKKYYIVSNGGWYIHRYQKKAYRLLTTKKGALEFTEQEGNEAIEKLKTQITVITFSLEEIKSE